MCIHICTYIINISICIMLFTCGMWAVAAGKGVPAYCTPYIL